MHLAISQNRALKIARLKVAENEQKKAGERSSYFPSLKNESNILHVTDLQNISIPAGAFGTAGGSYVPSQNTHPSARANHVVHERHAALAAAYAIDPDP